MKFRNAQMIVLAELTVLFLMESNIMNKLITISRLAFTGSANVTVFSKQTISNSNGLLNPNATSGYTPVPTTTNVNHNGITVSSPGGLRYIY